MKVAVIDADLISRKKHHFPNLASEKISAYWKENKAEVELKLDYNGLNRFDLVFVSKVFTDTMVPEWIRKDDQIHIGGTGFYFDKAPKLPREIEHHMPDYKLYDSCINSEINYAKNEALKKNKEFNYQKFKAKYKEYTDYSIGFMTRGCFRKCKFCVNQKYDHVYQHSLLDEFYYNECKKICLLDDNFFGCPQWRVMLLDLIDKNKPFKFKQGLDERLLNEEKCEILFSSRYDGDYTFAFDNVSEYDLIHSKLKMIRQYTKTTSVKFYVLVGFQSIDALDIHSAFKRIALLMKYKCLPYIMRYQNKNYAPWTTSLYRGMYISLARWCNQPSIFKKMSFRQFCIANQSLHKTEGHLCSAMRSMLDFEKEYPQIAKEYFDLRYEDFDI